MLLQNGFRYRMPVIFGPTPGPRQGPDGQPFNTSAIKRVTSGISFLTDGEKLAQYLPSGCRLYHEPVVTVEHSILRNLDWLAGRGYSIVSVKYPVRCETTGGSATGSFLSVLWENRPEPILSGREELGFAKLYCELPEPRTLRGKRTCEASWDGHTFMRMTLSDLADAPAPATAPSDGVLHHRYIPAVSPGGQAINEMVISPAGGDPGKVVRYQRGAGTLAIIRSGWEELPTMAHIINALADLPIRDYRNAWLVETRGASDLSEQRVLGNAVETPG